MKRLFAIVLISILITGCVKKVGSEEKQHELEYTVLPKIDIPEEFQKKIDEAQKEEFYLTYADQGYLYLARGYGTQPTSGYSISVMDIYDTENTICFRTALIGPKQSEQTKESESYPYIVVKIEYMEKEVMFQS